MLMGTINGAVDEDLCEIRIFRQLPDAAQKSGHNHKPIPVNRGLASY